MALKVQYFPPNCCRAEAKEKTQVKCKYPKIVLKYGIYIYIQCVYHNTVGTNLKVSTYNSPSKHQWIVQEDNV